MHSVSDLTTFARRTTGDVPPSLVVSTMTRKRSMDLIADDGFRYVLPGGVYHRRRRQNVPFRTSRGSQPIL